MYLNIYLRLNSSRVSLEEQHNLCWIAGTCTYVGHSDGRGRIPRSARLDSGERSKGGGGQGVSYNFSMEFREIMAIFREDPLCFPRNAINT